jgi:hypothetical protein
MDSPNCGKIDTKYMVISLIDNDKRFSLLLSMQRTSVASSKAVGSVGSLML